MFNRETSQMRILTIANYIFFPTNEVNFQKSWYYLFCCEQVKKVNNASVICDRNLKFDYLPERVFTQFLLFNPQVIIIQLAAQKEKRELIVNSLAKFKDKLPNSIKVLLLPTEDLSINAFLVDNEITSSLFNREKFIVLINSLNKSYTTEDNRKIFDYLNLVV